MSAAFIRAGQFQEASVRSGAPDARRACFHRHLSQRGLTPARILSPPPTVSARTISSSRSIPGMLIQQQRAAHVCCVWTRPTPDRNEDWVKPSYVPQPQQQPLIQPREEPRPLYSPSAPEFRPAELPDKQTEMPEGPKMPGALGDRIRIGGGQVQQFVGLKRPPSRCTSALWACSLHVQSSVHTTALSAHGCSCACLARKTNSCTCALTHCSVCEQHASCCCLNQD